MPFVSPITDPERILLYGGPGTGKTTSWFSIAKFYALTHTPGTFYILDTDSTTSRMVQSSYSDLPNLVVKTAFDWPEYRRYTAEFYKLAKPNDWIIIDQISSAWSTLQRYFTDEVFHKDMGDYFLQARKAMAEGDKKLKTFQGWTDWQVINAMYLDFIQPLTLRPKCNLLATAIADPVSTDNDVQTIQQIFGKFGLKPAGQKHLAYQFHTVLLTSYDVSHKWTLQTPKDRERAILQGAANNNFARDYLMTVAGWSIK